MRALYRITKRANEVVQYPFNFGDWLSQPEVAPGARPVSYAVGDVPDLVESYTQQGDTLVLNLNGGDDGEIYRVPVTATAANGLTRSTILEVSVLGVREDDDDQGGGGPINVEDSLALSLIHI